MSRQDEFRGGLSHEDRVSVAEQVMERGGLAGRPWHVPVMHYDDPTRVIVHGPVHAFVHTALIGAGVDPDVARRVKVHPKAWELRESGSGQAMTDGLNYIKLAGEHTNDMTLLHEAAHIVHGTSEGEGHGSAFQDTLEGMYRRHLGEEAAKTFRQIVRHS